MNKIQISLTDEFINEIASGTVSDDECESAAQHLRNYKEILDAQPVPVEPECVKYLGCSDVSEQEAVTVREYIDSLQSALKLAQEERDNEKEVRNCISRAHEAEQKRAEKAESLAEQNRKDAERYRFAKDIFAGDDSAETNAKVLGIAAGLVAGMDVDTAIDQARAE